ncbi:MAG: hypothetical protein IT303_16230 [Dehalococcoidia bacterium]|nr:hypothetical protein [Dehalococcoidia bacterium]
MLAVSRYRKLVGALAGAALVAVVGGGLVLLGEVRGPTSAPAATVAAPELGELVPPDLAEPRVFGRFRVVPAGLALERCGPPAPEGAVALATRRVSGHSLDLFRESKLFFEPRSVPAGYTLRSAELVTTTWDDRTASDTFFAVEYAGPAGQPLRFEMISMPRACQVDVEVPPAESGQAVTLARVDGFKALFFVPAGDAHRHTASGAWVLTDRMLATVSAPGIDAGELYEMVRFVAAACG